MSCPLGPGLRHPTVAILAMQHLQQDKSWSRKQKWDRGIGVGVMGHGGGKRANHSAPQRTRVGDRLPTIQPCDSFWWTLSRPHN